MLQSHLHGFSSKCTQSRRHWSVLRTNFTTPYGKEVWLCSRDGGPHCGSHNGQLIWSWWQESLEGFCCGIFQSWWGVGMEKLCESNWPTFQRSSQSSLLSFLHETRSRSGCPRQRCWIGGVPSFFSAPSRGHLLSHQALAGWYRNFESDCAGASLQSTRDSWRVSSTCWTCPQTLNHWKSEKQFAEKSSSSATERWTIRWVCKLPFAVEFWNAGENSEATCLFNFQLLLQGSTASSPAWRMENPSQSCPSWLDPGNFWRRCPKWWFFLWWRCCGFGRIGSVAAFSLWKSAVHPFNLLPPIESYGKNFNMCGDPRILHELNFICYFVENLFSIWHEPNIVSPATAATILNTPNHQHFAFQHLRGFLQANAIHCQDGWEEKWRRQGVRAFQHWYREWRQDRVETNLSILFWHIV